MEENDVAKNQKKKIAENETPNAKWKIKDPRTWKEWCLTNCSFGECVDNDPFMPNVLRIIHQI